MPVPKEILYLTEADVKKTITPAEAVDLAEKGITADAAGKVNGDKYYMNVGEHGFIKPFSGYIAGESLAFVKTFSYFPINPEKYSHAKIGPSKNHGNFRYFSRTGRPRA